MANDFKRMWTEEEKRNIYNLNHLYLNDGEIFVSNQLFDTIVKHNFLIYGTDVYVLNYVEKDGDLYANYVYLLTNGEIVQIINIEKDYDTLCRVNKTTTNPYENLVRETPTDVSIIEDQGKLELMLEHDGNVLAVNDTPNQFLQRRLNNTGRFVYSDEDEGDYKVQFINNYDRINNASIMRFTDFDGMEKDILGTIVNISQDATIPSRFAFRIDTLGVYIHKLNNEVVFIDRVIVSYEEIVYHYTKLDGTSGYQTTTNLGLYVHVL